jgi:hypothetical protein
MGGKSGRKVRTAGARVIDGAPALFLHEPRTEQEVVCLFGALLDDLGMVIDLVQTPFPDCIVWKKGTDTKLLVEFELYASHFLDHGHDRERCDMLVCWHDDVGDWPDGFVLELSEVVATRRPELIKHIVTRDPQLPWNRSSFLNCAVAEGTSDRDIELAKRIMAFAKQHKLGPDWLVNPAPVFAVGQHQQYFKVGSTGRIGFPFSRLKTGRLFSSLRERLNAAVPALEIEQADRSSKGKGGQLSELFDTDAQLEEFLEVWRWFSDAAHSRD